jgi:phenylalanyl-tRNA synthetase alpha chain
MSPIDITNLDLIELAARPLEELGISEQAAMEALFGRLDAGLAAETSGLQSGASAEAVEALRVRWLGRKQGIIRSITDGWLKNAPGQLKRMIGQRANALRQAAEQQIDAIPVRQDGSVAHSGQKLTSTVGSARVVADSALDITLPGTHRPIGVRHPLRQVINDMVEIFTSLGYSVEDGPEIESTYFNFEALNIPEHHPSRDDQDTFYITPDTVLRTHTSPVQIRTMEHQQPPLRIIVPGRVYRRDAPDATHSPMFHQVEGLAVDTHITFADLKGTLDYFMKSFFGPMVQTRFRPSFFPFTEPSAEVDISCLFCAQAGCRVCKGSGWIELLGCGMVDPALYSFVQYDSTQYSGFAFGMGVERLAMLKYGVQDIQQFYHGDIRFLHQFR